MNRYELESEWGGEQQSGRADHPRKEWQRPQLQRMEAGAAEIRAAIVNDTVFSS